MNRYRILTFTLVFGLSIAVCSPVCAGILFQRALGVNRSANIFDTDQFDLDLTLGDQFFNPTNPVTLFDSLSITPADVGSTFDATSISDGAFDTVAARFSDAQDEFVRLIFTEDESGGLEEQRGWSESLFFLGLSTPSIPDLAGASIDQVSMTIDLFNLIPDSEPSPPGPPPLGPPVDLQMTLTIYGTIIPEPATAGLLLAGLAGLVIVGRNGVAIRRSAPVAC